MRTEAAAHNANDDNVVDGQRDDDDDNDNYDNDESGTRDLSLEQKSQLVVGDFARMSSCCCQKLPQSLTDMITMH